MKKILYLVHRIPYPPDKGDKISSYNLLRYFAERHQVYLGAFIDDPADWAYEDKIAEICAQYKLVGLNPRWRKFASLAGLLSGRSLSEQYYRNTSLGRWVDQMLEAEKFDAILIYSGPMAQFISGKAPAGTRLLFEPEDVDSEKWREYAAGKPWPMSAIYAREARTLLAFERKMAVKADVTVFISPNEAELFRKLAPESADKVTHRTQGVDNVHFDPGVRLENPYDPGTRTLVFVGAMDYWPNVDAVSWYVSEVLPALREKVPDAVFAIVGRKPTAQVQKLAKREGVMVTGGVDDVRPYVKYAHAACLPIRVARGIQNKALEAMAMEKLLLASPEAMEGIEVGESYAPLIASGAEEFLARSVEILGKPVQIIPEARQLVLEHYNWDTNLRQFEEILFGNSRSVEGLG